MSDQSLLTALQSGILDDLCKALRAEAMDINEHDSLCQTPLIMAIREKNSENRKAFFKEFLSYKPDLLFQSYPFGTALTASIYLQHWGIANTWISAEIEQNKKFSPNKHPTAINWLIRHINEENEQEKSPLLGRFIDAGADLNADNEVAAVEHPGWVWTALSCEDCPFASDSSQIRYDLPLNSAVMSENKEIIKLLIRNGAEPENKNSWGKIARDLAEYTGDAKNIKEALNEDPSTADVAIMKNSW